MVKNLKGINFFQNGEAGTALQVVQGAFWIIVCTNNARLIHLPGKHSCLGKAFIFLSQSNFSQEMTYIA